MKYQHRFLVNAPLATAAAFHSRAASMAAITPPPIIVRMEQAPSVLSEGDKLSFTMWLGPLPVRWVARIESVSSRGFTDRQLQGPFAEWAHRHSFIPVDGGATAVVDEVTVRLRRHLLWGPAGLAMWLGMPVLFAYRAWKTKRLVRYKEPAFLPSHSPALLAPSPLPAPSSPPRVVILGAGVGGLVTAAVLARSGLDVTVLEAQVYPGGCASTYFHQGYRFDTGATLAAGFYPGGPMDQVSRAAGIAAWPARAAETAMVVHLPGGMKVERLAGQARWDAYRAAFGEAALGFFRWQEQTADALWNLALRNPPWPPQSSGDAAAILKSGLSWLGSRALNGYAHITGLAVDAFRPLAPRLDGLPEALKLFVDAQLLISAQATSESANALYSAAALDLPRRGVAYLQGGMGAIAETLVEAVRSNGGRVLYRQQAARIQTERGLPVAVETKRGESFPADVVISNLTPWNTAELLANHLPGPLRRLPARPDGWGAFMVYVGLDGARLPPDLPLHHQVVLGQPMGGGNTVFASLSPAWDPARAPEGQRALTLSTHTPLAEWWQLFEHDRPAYEARKAELAEKVLAAAEVALPGLRKSARLVMPGTPVTFQHFTRRKWGWVGGFPQTSLLRSLGPRIGKNIWLVGDSIFPGQSTAAVALGGLRVAGMVLAQRQTL